MSSSRTDDSTGRRGPLASEEGSRSSRRRTPVADAVLEPWWYAGIRVARCDACLGCVPLAVRMALTAVIVLAATLVSVVYGLQLMSSIGGESKGELRRIYHWEFPAASEQVAMKEASEAMVTVAFLDRPLAASDAGLRALDDLRVVSIGGQEHRLPPLSPTEAHALQVPACGVAATSGDAGASSEGRVKATHLPDSAAHHGLQWCPTDGTPAPVLRLGAGSAKARWEEHVLREVDHVKSTAHAVRTPALLSNGDPVFFVPTDQVGGKRTLDAARRRVVAQGAMEQVNLMGPMPDLALYAVRAAPLPRSDAEQGGSEAAFGLGARSDAEQGGSEAAFGLGARSDAEQGGSEAAFGLGARSDAWRGAEGVLLVYLSDSDPYVYSSARRAAQFHARAWGAAAVVSWRSHVWGSDPSVHSTLMQTTTPVAPGLKHLKGESVAHVLLPPTLAGFDPEDFVTESGKRRVRPPSDAWQPPAGDSSRQQQKKRMPVVSGHGDEL